MPVCYIAEKESFQSCLRQQEKFMLFIMYCSCHSRVADGKPGNMIVPEFCGGVTPLRASGPTSYSTTLLIRLACMEGTIITISSCYEITLTPHRCVYIYIHRCMNSEVYNHLIVKHRRSVSSYNSESTLSLKKVHTVRVKES